MSCQVVWVLWILAIPPLIVYCQSNVTEVAETMVTEQMEVVNVTRKILPDRCLVKTEPGPCKHYIYKWTFNKAEGKCRTFLYGGCLGNENRFNSEIECLHYCIGGPEREYIQFRTSLAIAIHICQPLI